MIRIPTDALPAEGAGSSARIAENHGKVRQLVR
ncbi:hypothetical protein EV686_104168 [Paracandidimonas soli]|uniref:Uncharacterized protein n=1 Tax=Paracandidimonas soli TaxID=1917182 RepID=A0A4V6P2R2_9BURK|nr:hypothetical protein EV686_104168 [Paracandidimonas soli]